MSGSPPSLQSVISSQAAAAEAQSPAEGNQSPTPSSPAPMTLQQAIDQTQVTPEVPGTQTVAAAVAGQPAPVVPPNAQEQAILRNLLSQRGLEIPEQYTNDDQIADAIAQQFDSYNETLSSPEYQEFTAKQAEFKAWLASQSAPAQQQQKPAEAAQVSESQLLKAISGGFISFDQVSKKWSPAHPQFASHADAMNAQDNTVQTVKASLATDPAAFIQQQIADALKSHTGQPSSEIAELKKMLTDLRADQDSARVAAESAQVQSWVDQNKTKIWGPDGKPTAYHDLYQTFEQAVESADPTLASKPIARHTEVLRRIAIAENAFKPTAPAQQPAAAQPKQSFLNGAAHRINGVNRLSEFEGAANNSVNPQVPRGKGGMPSLSGIIEQQTALSQQ